MSVKHYLAVFCVALMPSLAVANDGIKEQILDLVERRLSEQRSELLEEITDLLDKLQRNATAEETVYLGGSPPENVFAYLRAKYDSNHDGQISAAEYDRGVVQFERLDRDGDGGISERDFARGLSRAPTQAMRKMYLDSEIMAPRILHRYFQESRAGSAESLSRQSLETALVSYDTSGDRRLARSELKSGLKSRGARAIAGISDYDRTSHLLAKIDSDQDGMLAFTEFLAYFEGRDKNHDGELSLAEAGRAAPQRQRAPAGARNRQFSGPKAGERAPDFELSLLGGGNPVRLSSFAGKQPVALIFGSYT